MGLSAAPLPEVKERQLRNGLRVMLVERPGSGALHASLFVRGGRAKTANLPPASADLLVRSLFSAPLPEDLGKLAPLDELLFREEGAWEALRLARIRQARMKMTDSTSEIEDLLIMHKRTMEPLQAKVEAANEKDVLETLSTSRRETEATADYLRYALDMPTSSLAAWCRLETARLKHVQLGRFPVERESRIREMGTVPQERRRALAILLGTALPGQPYAQVEEEEQADLEAINWTDMRAYGRWTLSPSRICLVLVGDLKANEIWPLLETSFGSLDTSSEFAGQSEVGQAEVPEREGSRTLHASIAGAPCLFLGWRVPPAPHPDRPGLDLLARILGDGQASRLYVRLVERGALVKELSVRTSVPGARETNLFMIEAKPAEGRFLEEIGQAIQSEILRLQREPLLETEIQRAQKLAEADQLQTQDDAARLARALGQAFCQAGDWHSAFPDQQSCTPTEIQALVRRYLVPSRATMAFLEPDLLYSPKDALEQSLNKALTGLVRRKVEDPARQEAIVREALKQLRMLTREERLQILKLLEVQVKP